MANRNFNRFQALEKEVKALYADVAIGATGAPTLTEGLGVASVVRDSAGVYIITLQDKYNRLMQVSAVQLAAAAEELTIQLEAEAVATSKTVTIRCIDAAAAETDPSNGSRLLIRIDVKNSTV